MKLRLTSDSVRLRLSGEEAVRLAAEGCVEETVRFGPSADQAFTYAVEAPEGAGEAGLLWDGGRLRIVVPAHEARRLASGPPGTSIESVHPTGGGSSLRLQIETDLPRRGKAS
ncbi:MAG: hypothetical protein Kow0059_15280 [Candidatus Sumerlaeia bacterium]